MVLGTLALVNEKLVEHHRRRTEVENRRLAAFPIKNPNPFLIFTSAGALKFTHPAAQRAVEALGLESVDQFLPADHAKLLQQGAKADVEVQDVESSISGRFYSFGYYPSPTGEDVFVYALDITERKHAEDQLKHDAMHDRLTGLPNRSLVMEILAGASERARRNDHYRFAVLLLDIDRFKVVNDSLGHLAGDEVLMQVATRLRGCLRPNDVIGRFGGDEFVVIVDDIDTVMQATRAAERIQTALDEPLRLGAQEITATVCIGIAMSDDKLRSPEDYLREADTAMYRAKTGARGGFEVFDHHMHEEAVSTLRIENDLRRAIDRDELVLYFQPYVSLSDTQVLGFEGLLRWHHPEVGVISPARFIPIAEESSLIVPVGDWVLRQGCAQLETWQRALDSDRPFTLSINVSSHQLPGIELPREPRRDLGVV